MVIGVWDFIEGTIEVLRFFSDLAALDFGSGKKKQERRRPFQPRGQTRDFVRKLSEAFLREPHTGPAFADPVNGQKQVDGFWAWAGEGYGKVDLAPGQPKRAELMMFGVRPGYYIEMPPAFHPDEAFAVILLPPSGDTPALVFSADRVSRKKGDNRTGPGLPTRTGKVAVIVRYDKDGKGTKLDQFAASDKEHIQQAIRLALGDARRAAA